MAHMAGRGVFAMDRPPSIKAYASSVGSKEGKGPLGKYFDVIIEDSHIGQESWEKAESQLQKQTVQLALKHAELKADDIEYMLAGDLINQCTGTSYSMRALNIPFFGIYGACSTMAEGLLLSSVLSDSGCGKYILNATSSHFSTAERQFRFPLSYGGQRTPSSQWTCTASGAALVSSEEDHAPYVIGGAVGHVIDLGVTDANNMGGAMAPAAADTIIRYLKASGRSADYFDYIVTGDLGTVGSELLHKLLASEGIELKNHKDCGVMMFDGNEQDTHAGGSGCGCSASVLCGYFLPRIKSGEIKRILFTATGALMSVMSSQQGESIPGIANLVHISHEKESL